MKISTKVILGSSFYMLWILQPLILWLLGTCQIQNSGLRSWDSYLVRFCIWTAAIYVLLIGPVVQFAYPELKKIKMSLGRKLALSAFFALPILSFGHYISHVTHAGALFDLVVSTLGLIILAVHIFEETQSVALLSLGLSVALYIQWFLVSDILSPFATKFQMIPASDAFYWGRIFLATAIVMTSFWKVRCSGRPVQGHSISQRQIALLIWMFVSVVLYFGVPWVLSFYEKDTNLKLSATDFLFLLIPVWILIEAITKIHRTWIKMGLGSVIAVAFLMKSGFTVLAEPANFFNLCWTMFNLVTALLIIRGIYEVIAERKLRAATH